MRRRFLPALLCTGFLLALCWWLLRPELLPDDFAITKHDLAAADIRHGEYLVNIAGCVSCHTDAGNKGAYLAGGLELETPLGTFFAPNITPDQETGIGAWTFTDFVRAMHVGVTPDNARYYPVFPYTSYTRMHIADLRDMFAYLQSIPPVKSRNRPHETPWYINRLLLPAWQALFFRPGVYRPAGHDASPDRGAYIANALTHCSECHTPRNLLGATRPELFLAGTENGPDGDPVPNITQSKADGIGDWDEYDLLLYLEDGEMPDGDYAGGAMVDVIDNSTGIMTAEDLQALVAYILSVPAVENN